MVEATIIDLRGTRCPLTLLKIKQYLYQSNKVELFQFLFDDAGAARDLPLYLAKDQHWALCIQKVSGIFTADCSRKKPCEEPQ